MMYYRGVLQFASIEDAQNFYEAEARKTARANQEARAEQAETIIKWAGKYADLAARYAELVEKAK